MKKRIQFEFTDQTIKFLDEIMYLTGSTKKPDVFKNALSVYGHILRRVKTDGYKVLLVKEGENDVELIIPGT